MDLAAHREGYAAAITSGRGIHDARIERAFATVPREVFLGDGPWSIFTPAGYVETSTADPSSIYDDVVVALSREKRINNGQPSLHARCMAAADVQSGERVLHIGCGSGYYTAILAELTTTAGTVVAWDVEPRLAFAASENLRHRPNVSVSCRSGTSEVVPPSDVIYVSAGCTRPMEAWVDALSLGGRLLFPLTPGWEFGGMLKVTRRELRLDAQFIFACSFIPCVGGSDIDEAERLRVAFARGGIEKVSSLHFGTAAPSGECWFEGDGWHLSLDRVS